MNAFRAWSFGIGLAVLGGAIAPVNLSAAIASEGYPSPHGTGYGHDEPPSQHLDGTEGDRPGGGETVIHKTTAEWVEVVEGKWEQEYEAHFQSDLPATAQDAAAIRDKLRQIDAQAGTRTALIYADMEEMNGQTFLKVVVTSGDRDWENHHLPEVTVESLGETVKALRGSVTSLETQRLLGVSSRGLDLAPAQQLYDWLLRPIAAALEADRIDRLIFCLGEGLRTVPLAALHDGEQFAIEQYAIAQIPGFSLLDARPIGNHRASRVLAMGASEFGDLSPLPGVPLELTAIADRFEQTGGGGRRVLNEGFTADNLRRQRRRGEDIVHLATHADFRSGPASSSFVQFWDGPVSMNRLGALDWQTPPVDLLVLSACKTAVGDRDSELGFAGLAVSAGVPTAIASLWTVSDLGTLALMDSFYERLTDAPTSVDALRLAQLDLLQGRVRIENQQLIRRDGTALPLPETFTDTEVDLSHPFHWGAFVAIGNPW